MPHFNKHYTYQLRKGSKKDRCPQCERMTFTPYVDESGNILSSDVGRCDRQDKCQYHYTPKEYIQDNPNYNREKVIASRQKNYNRMQQQKIHEPSYIDVSDFSCSMKGYKNNSLCRYFHSVFDSLIAPDEVEQTLIEYGVGTSKQFGGSPIFWLIDQYGRIRDGKIMGYNPNTGKRIKNPYPLFTNVHSLLKQKYNGDFKPCYFGSHLVKLHDKKNKTIWLFESEKAALIVALAFVWGGSKNLVLPMATAGCEAFNPTSEHKIDIYDRIHVLKDRNVILFPDEGKYQDWKNKGYALRGFAKQVFISPIMEQSLNPFPVKCEIKKGDALDDLLIRYFENNMDASDLLIHSYSYKDRIL